MSLFLRYLRMNIEIPQAMHLAHTEHKQSHMAASLYEHSTIHKSQVSHAFLWHGMDSTPLFRTVTIYVV